MPRPTAAFFVCLGVVVLTTATPVPEAGGFRRAAGEPPAGLTGQEWSQIRSEIEASAYHASPARRPGGPSVVVASNRAQAYRTTFRPAGIEIVPQTPGTSWRLGVSVTGYGYQGDVGSLPVAEPEATKERVEYRRGPLTEWYVNGPGGLEQGFEIEEPKARHQGPLVIEMAVRGGLTAAVDGDDIEFRDGAEAVVVRYTGLKAWDADRLPLSARLEAAGREVRIVLEAQAARFPVTVDPAFVQEAALGGRGEPHGRTGGLFGRSASISGDTLLVGEAAYDPDDPYAGTVHVLVRSGTVWGEQQKLMPADGAGGDQFGHSVSVSGDTAVVGANSDDTQAGQDAGSAYVFVRSGGVWTQQQKLTASDGLAFQLFGDAVALAGDTIIVGAPTSPSCVSNAGAAYVFIRSGTAWTQQQKLVASDAGASGAFGGSLAVSGDTAVVGASRDGSPAGPNAGSAYVFVRSGAAWSQRQKLTAPPFASFGESMSMSGDTLAIGAPGETTPAGAGAGSVYVFVPSGEIWNLQQKLTPLDGAALRSFGGSVSVSGDTLAAGEAYEGSAYVFARAGTVWGEQQKLTTPGGEPHAFGSAIAVSGDAIVAGSPVESVGSAFTGAAFVFVRSGTVWTERQRLVGSDAPGDAFGRSVSISGDTLAVAAPGDHVSPGATVGSAYVFVRSGTAWAEQQKVTASDAGALGSFGASLAVSGDTMVIGAPGYGGPPGLAPGAVYVFERSGTVWTQQQRLLASDGGLSHGFGAAVSISGTTMVVGAPGDARAGGAAGAAYVFVRSGTTWTEQQKLVATNGESDGLFGASVSISGDTIVAGAFYDDSVGLYSGSAYVFVRTGTVWTQQQKLTASDGLVSQWFGREVSVSGDTVVVGAPERVPAAYVFVRAGTIWTEQQKLTAWDGGLGFGRSVFVAGDTAAVGAPYDDAGGQPYRGSAYVFARSGSAWNPRQKLLAPDGLLGDGLGASLSFSGDTLVVGAPYDDAPAGETAGSARVFRLQDVPTADLSLTLTDSPDPVVGLQPLGYTIAVNNAGPQPATAVSVTQSLPATVSFQSAGGAGWTCGEAGGAVTCTRPSLAVGAAPAIMVTVAAPPTAQTLSSSASVGAAEVDPLLLDNSDTETTAVTAAPLADLAVTKSDGGMEIRWGQPFTWTIAATNFGPTAVTGSTVVDVFPPGVAGVSWTCTAATGSSCPAGGSGNISASVDLPLGGTATFTATGTVQPGTTTLANTATIAPPAGIHDPSAGNNRSTTLTILPAQYYALAPCRVIDTRTTASPLAANSTRTFTVAGACQVPADARAVAALLIAVNPGAFGNLRLYPTGASVPLASTLNFSLGRTRANNALLPLGTGGQVNVQCDMPPGSTASTHFVLDVVGYFK